LKDALSVYEKQVGPYNPRFALTYNWLGACAQARGQLDKADQFQRKALDIHEKVDGPNSAEAAQIWTNIGNISVAQGKLNEAERQHRKALEIRENVLTKNHPQTAMSVHNLGAVLRMQGKAKEAEANGLRAVEMYRATNPNHGELVYPLRMLTDLCIEQKRWPDAEKHARAWLGVLEADRDDSLDELAETSFRRLDVNGDNKLNRDEMPARLKDNLAKWDRNDDGLVDAGEYRTYFSAELGDAVAPQHPGTTAMIEPLERLATILTATDRRDEAATVTKRKDSLKSKLASEKK
jgi:tetratricopeptide (TPR) repeat protein